MRKSVLSMLAVLALSFALTGCNQPKTGSVAVVNTARIYQESEAGKAGVKHLESLHNDMQAQLNKMQAELQKNPGEETSCKFQQLYADLQQRMGAEQQQVITVLNENLQRVLDAYREQKGLDLIVANEGVLSVNARADVTADIVAELNKTQITFKPIEAEAPKAEPAKEEAAKVEADKAAPAANATAKQ